MSKMTRIRPNITRVKNLDTEQEGTVRDVLSTQLTVDYDDGSFNFLFIADREVTWKSINDEEAASRTNTLSAFNPLSDISIFFDDTDGTSLEVIDDED